MFDLHVKMWGKDTLMNHHITTSIHTGVQREDRCCVGIFPTKSINRRLFVGCYRPSEAIMANPTDLVTDLIYRTHLLFMKSHISLPHPSESRLPEFPTNVRKGLDQKIMRQQLYSKRWPP